MVVDVATFFLSSLVEEELVLEEGDGVFICTEKRKGKRNSVEGDDEKQDEASSSPCHLVAALMPSAAGRVNGWNEMRIAGHRRKKT